MLLKLRWYKFKIECHNFRMLNITTKKKAIQHTQKEIRRKLKFHCKKLNPKETLIQHDRNTSLSIITLNVN